MWYHIKDPDQFKLKPPRRWDPSGLKKHAPRPFYNREDGHFLLNNTCTIANLCLLPELRRLQCYFFSKLPKIRKERNFWLPMKKVRTHSFRCIHMRFWDFELELPRGLEAFQRCPSWWCFIKLQNSDTVSEKLCNSCNFLNVSRWSFWPIWRGQWIQYNDFSWSSEWNKLQFCVFRSFFHFYDYHSKANLLTWVVNLVDEAHHFLSTTPFTLYSVDWLLMWMLTKKYLWVAATSLCKLACMCRMRIASL
jgi:hypothetical protein